MLDLRTLTQYNTCLEFPIQLANGVTSQGTLVVQVTFTPQANLDDNRKPKGKKIPNFRLELTKVDYLPGEPVTGFLVYNATKERKIRNIRLDFVGKEHVYWTERHGKFTVVYTQTVLHIDQRVIMIGKEKEKMALQAQFYRFPFTFHLPATAPPTMHKTIGNIWYTLKGTVDIPMAIDKTTDFEIAVHRPVHNILRSLQPVRDEYVNEKVEGLKIKVSVNKRTYMLGEIIQLEFVVDNKSTHKIDEINVKLKQAEEYQATTKTRYQKHAPFSIKVNKDVLPIRSGAVWDYGFSLAIPVQHIVPSLEQNVTNIIFVRHFVAVTFHYGTLKKTKVRIPVTLLEPLTANFPQYAENSSAPK
jgi:sporulation-control protein spo0M